MNYVIYNRKIRVKKNIEHVFSIPVRINPLNALFHVELDEIDGPNRPGFLYFNLIGIRSQKQITVTFETDCVKTSRYITPLSSDTDDEYLLVGCKASELLFFTLTVEVKKAAEGSH